jgi:hypothetical protein
MERTFARYLQIWRDNHLSEPTLPSPTDVPRLVYAYASTVHSAPEISCSDCQLSPFTPHPPSHSSSQPSPYSLIEPRVDKLPIPLITSTSFPPTRPSPATSSPPTTRAWVSAVSPQTTARSSGISPSLPADPPSALVLANPDPYFSMDGCRWEARASISDNRFVLLGKNAHG